MAATLSNVLPFPGAVQTDDLLERLRDGDPRAVAIVYRRHGRRVRAFAKRMLGDESAAEDVVHDAFVALPAAIRRFRGDSALETFIISIAVNLCRRHIRSAIRGRRAVERLRQREVLAPVRSPEYETRRRQLADALRRGLATLSVDHREVFVLCAVEERTSREVAEILDVPDGTVRTRLFHARKKLRVFLEQEGVR